ncbi:MAG TPA: ROK family protein, partial [Turneriella sp.]|nr:ROK family protein [Turneriella sp.]
MKHSVYPILGIDIGATTVKFATLNAAGVLGERRALPIASQSNAAFIEQLISIVEDAAFSQCQSVGIGSPGPLDLERGCILSSANMPQIKNLEVIALLKNKFPTKIIRLDNDATCATLGQKFFGVAKTWEDFAVFTLGTGVGGGAFFHNRLERGYKGNFFEVGHIPVDAMRDAGRQCGCGNRGCLEAYASATGIAFSYKEETGVDMSAKDIAARAREGDTHAQAAFSLAAHALALGAAAITQTTNITSFIFT